MQQIHRTITPRVKWSRADGPPSVETGGYGYGLFITDDMAIGQTVGHGGGYPGFGSHMRWHPASGIGVIAFGNGRYAPMTSHVVEALRSLVDRGGRPHPPRYGVARHTRRLGPLSSDCWSVGTTTRQSASSR